MKQPRVAFVVNGGPGSAMALRAEAFAVRLSGFDCRIVHRTGGKLLATERMARGLAAARPDVCYVLDCGASGVAAAGLHRLRTGTPLVLDTGDAVVELGRALGRGRIGIAATRTLENYALRSAAAVVVRGGFHQELFAARGVPATFIPDGVAVDQFAPSHRATRPANPLTIGLVGSSVWLPARQTCYGWELVELVRLLRDRVQVRGILIGDGSGIPVLRRRCADYGLTDRIEFAGRVPYAELPAQLRGFDICLSTQTNDVIGNVRTTGKLPLYLAAGRFVLASRVGEAARVLPSDMLVDFHGEHDFAYPGRLAERVEMLVGRGIDFSHRPDCVELAREHFEYDRLAPRVAEVLEGVIERTVRRMPQHV
ncbi:MAG TPA: glycosyltransferase [Gemmataceae bacterium]|nr:glycosyltransferase [Gemmataceae bacterium]